MSIGQQSDAACAAPQAAASARVWQRIGEALWRGVVPEAIGLALLALLLIAVVAMTLVANRVIDREVAEAVEEEAQRAARMCAAVVARLAPGDDAENERMLASLAQAAGADSIRWLNGQAAVIAAAGPNAAGKHTTAQAGVARGEARVEGADQSTAGRVEVWLPLPAPPLIRPALLLGGAAVLATILPCFLLVYWRLRRHVRPLAAIERNLTDYAAGVERDLQALALSDALGASAAAWNRLLAQVLELKELAGRPGGGDPADNAIQRFESRSLRMLMNHLPLGLLRVNAAERITYANAMAERLLGRALGSLAGQSLSEVIGEQYANALLHGAARGTREVTISSAEAGGQSSATLRLATVATGDVIAGDALLIIEDITHLREAERGRDSFLYHITHELRTPLTNIHAYAETLSRPDFDDEQTRRECYNVIISETRRLSTLVEDILNISQLEVGTARIEVDAVDIVRLLRAMVQDNLAAADAKQVDLTLKLPPKAPQVRGDKQRLAMLINNLIGNAVKYTPAGGRVEVSLEVGEGVVRICVKDTGIGIPPAEQPRVFEKFYRASNAQMQATPGTGLGLAIAREVARLHGGDVWLTSEVGKGSTFVAEIPAVTTPA